MGRKNRTYTTDSLLRMRFKPFRTATDRLKAMLGEHIESSAVVYVYGESGSGKSTFVNELYQALSECVKKMYHNNVESGKSRILQLAVARLDLKCQVVWADRHSFEEMLEQVKKNRCNVVGLDSVDKARMSYEQYLELESLAKKRGKILVLIGRATGRQHSTSIGERICFDADVKVYIAEGVAYVNSRYGAVQPYVMCGVAEHHARMKATLKKVKKGEALSAVAAERQGRFDG